MRRPGLRTLLLGSRLTAPPIMLGCAYTSWRWWEDGGVGILGIVTGVLFIVAFKAMGEVSAYRRWRSDWQAMSGRGQRPSLLRSPFVRQGIVAVIAAVAMMALLYYGTRPEAGLLMHGLIGLWVVGGGALALAILAVQLVRRFVLPHLPRRSPAVSIAIGRPLMAAPSIKGCYRRLPPYCKQLLKGGK